ncbi:hypothetical protein CRN15_27865 (plasmid) [Raoultella planticola]|uniref:hypothetical protein n=1 Tax=Raoultella planticola TaxID=575 RepID=UPI000BFF2856|nr:hypothetical protein [Raoultella planticola]ATM18622.1 hypothetical protein CRN15_27865 [Raoultella planticola]
MHDDSCKRRYRQFSGGGVAPDDLIIGDYAFKVNTSTEFIYMFYAVRAWKATAPDSTGHRRKSPETAGLTEQQANPLPAKP